MPRRSVRWLGVSFVLMLASAPASRAAPNPPPPPGNRSEHRMFEQADYTYHQGVFDVHFNDTVTANETMYENGCEGAWACMRSLLPLLAANALCTKNAVAPAVCNSTGGHLICIVRGAQHLPIRGAGAALLGRPQRLGGGLNEAARCAGAGRGARARVPQPIGQVDAAQVVRMPLATTVSSAGSAFDNVIARGLQAREPHGRGPRRVQIDWCGDAAPVWMHSAAARHRGRAWEGSVCVCVRGGAARSQRICRLVLAGVRTARLGFQWVEPEVNWEQLGLQVCTARVPLRVPSSCAAAARRRLWWQGVTRRNCCSSDPHARFSPASQYLYMEYLQETQVGSRGATMSRAILRGRRAPPSHAPRAERVF